MSYLHKDGETNQERQARLDAEYIAYVSECKTTGVDSINYMNWLTSKKFSEKAEQNGGR